MSPSKQHMFNKQFFQKSVRWYQSSKNAKIITLVSKGNSEYGVMSLNALKNECRKRGLKVSGRKQELVNRLTSNDTAGGYHTMGAGTRNVGKVGAEFRPVPEMVLQKKDLQKVKNFSTVHRAKPAPLTSVTQKTPLKAQPQRGVSQQVAQSMAPRAAQTVSRQAEPAKLQSTKFSMLSKPGVQTAVKSAILKPASIITSSARFSNSEAALLTFPDLLSEPKHIETPIKMINLHSPEHPQTTQNIDSTTPTDIVTNSQTTKISSDTPISENTVDELGADLQSQLQKLVSFFNVDYSQDTSSTTSSGSGKYEYQEYEFGAREKKFFAFFGLGTLVYWVIGSMF